MRSRRVGRCSRSTVRRWTGSGGPPPLPRLRAARQRKRQQLDHARAAVTDAERQPQTSLVLRSRDLSARCMALRVLTVCRPPRHTGPSGYPSELRRGLVELVPEDAELTVAVSVPARDARDDSSWPTSGTLHRVARGSRQPRRRWSRSSARTFPRTGEPDLKSSDFGRTQPAPRKAGINQRAGVYDACARLDGLQMITSTEC